MRNVPDVPVYPRIPAHEELECGHLFHLSAQFKNEIPAVFNLVVRVLVTKPALLLLLKVKGWNNFHCPCNWERLKSVALTLIKLGSVGSSKRCWPFPPRLTALGPRSWPNKYANSAAKTKQNMAHVAPPTISKSYGVNRSSSVSAKLPDASPFPTGSEPSRPPSSSATKPSNPYSLPYSPLGQADTRKTRHCSMLITPLFTLRTAMQDVFHQLGVAA